ncbi:MAG: arsenic transporter [Streptosporangiales bacterium]|nr:arsenic transporter [Streptosporangiales bacterium]
MWRWAAAGGLVCVAGGLIPLRAAGELTLRIVPILLFLVAVTVLAELADEAEVFDLAAVEAARLARGRTLPLYLVVVALGAATTVVLSLDTTAVLLTPVVLSLAIQLELAPLPFAMAAVWLANTASLLLPVSNLTNLLAVDRLGMSVAGFAGRMWLPALVAVVVTSAVLLVVYRRQLRGTYVVPPRRRPSDPVLFWIATAVCVAAGPAFVAGAPVWLVACAGAGVLVTCFAVRRRKVLRLALVPWRLVLLVEGLFLVVDTLDRWGLRRALATVAGGAGAGGVARTAVVTAALANVTNNLPAYYAMEGVAGSEQHLLAVLAGANAGPLILMWGSLATLLWRERCRSRGVHVTAAHFAAVGAAGVPLVLGATVVTLLLTA